MYKLVANDLDDTLLTDDRRITAATKAALTEAASRGTVITLATGRMYASASAVARELGINVPLITYQGALVKNALVGKVLYERNLPEAIALDLLDYCLQNELHLQGYVDDRLYAREDNDKIKAYCELSKIPYTIAPDFERIIRQPQTKMLIIDEPDKLDIIADELRAKYRAGAHITKSKPHFLEIMHPEGTKGHALRFLAEYYGCSLAETIAIGDSWNDHDMIEVAGLGVAMANAVDSLKQVADYVTDSNNDDGVKAVIDRFIVI